MANTVKYKTIFAKNLNAVLKARKISARAAASLANVSASTMADWLTGASPKNLFAVLRLSKSLGVSFSWLLIGDEDNSHNPTQLEDLVAREERPIVSGIYYVEIKKIKLKGTR